MFSADLVRCVAGLWLGSEEVRGVPGGVRIELSSFRCIYDGVKCCGLLGLEGSLSGKRFSACAAMLGDLLGSLGGPTLASIY